MNALHTLQEVVQQNPLIPKASCVRLTMTGRIHTGLSRGKGKKAQDRAAMLRPLPILSEEDVDAMAEQDSEGRTFNRQFPINPHD